MARLRRFFLFALAALSLMALAIYLIPLDAYVPEVEHALAGRLHEPAKVRQLRVVPWPLPHLELRDVHVGGDGIVLRSVEVHPAWSGLLTGRMAIRRIEIEEGVAHLAQLRKLTAILKKGAQLEQGGLRELRFSGMHVLAPEGAIGPVEGRVEFTEAGALKVAWFAMDRQKASLTLLPQEGGDMALVMQARGWTAPRLPQLPQLPMDEMLLIGTLSEHDVVVQRLTAVSAGIQVAASGRLDFSDGWRMQATLSDVDAPLERLMALADRPVDLKGRFRIKGELTAEADTPAGLGANLRFEGDAHLTQVKARIAPEFKQPLVLNEVRAHVMLRPDRLELKGIRGGLYGGSLSGALNIERGKSVLNSDLNIGGVNMQPLMMALANAAAVSGTLDATAMVALQLDALQRFPASLDMSADFTLRDGVIGKVDLAQAAKIGIDNQAGAGSGTRFDELEGLLVVDAAGYHFKKISIKSSILAAKGNVDVSPARQLDGRLDASIGGMGGLASIPLVISGTLNDPVVRPSKTAMAGAAVGTALLGPGLGTAVGVKVGGFLDKLFGKNGDAGKTKELPTAEGK